MAYEPHFTITIPIASALTEIERTRGFLDGANLSADWISKMQERALILEAHHTTHIEGTHLNLNQSEKLISGENVPGVDAEEVKELLNYKTAFEFVADYVSSQNPITEGVIREIHKYLVEGVRGNNAQPGEYRKIQNYVANEKTKEIIYTPPPAYEIPRMMAELVTWIQQENSIPAVLIAGIAQFQLVHIHPFLDGNGRCARLLSTLCLYRSGYDFKKLFSISEYYDRNRRAYYDAIQSVRINEMDLTRWLEYFSLALATQMNEIQSKGADAIKLDLVSSNYQLSDRQKVALEYLLGEKKVLTIQQYESLCPETNRRSLQRDLADLAEKGLIFKEGEKKAAVYRLNSDNL